jgi:hypothetical protein
MGAIPAIPLTVDPEASALVAELGLQAELERMLEHARHTVSGLLQLYVVFAPPYDTGPDPAIVIEAHRDPTARQPDDQTWYRFSRWQIATFSPDVFRHFVLLIMDEHNHAG